jgi:hypothetical protein
MFCYYFPFLFLSFLHQSFVCTNIILMQHFEMRRKEPKWPIWGQKAIFWPFANLDHTVHRTVMHRHDCP